MPSKVIVTAGELPINICKWMDSLPEKLSIISILIHRRLIVVATV